MTLTDAYRTCLEIARSHYENFPVASGLVPSALRHHIAAIYAFARRADDAADEGTLAAEVRREVLDEFTRRLRTPVSTDAVDVALADTIETFRLPYDPFDRLLAAFISDVYEVNFTSWDDLLAYCHCSADPVGELLLRLDNAPALPSDESISFSNDVCTALQITNFLQDISTDRQRGRSYLPLPHHECITRTLALYNRGRRVAESLSSWRLRWEIRLTIAGGLTMLDLCARRTDDRQRPTLTVRNALHLFRRLVDVVRQKPLPNVPVRLNHDANS
ncbi:MAG: squalene synthase HpnC [Candidatus Kapabacteria bacterium]|nr:squalene synthase HpnC [Candidatus Kapabacteria bacterium]